MRRRTSWRWAIALSALPAFCSTATAQTVPTPDHIVILIEENRPSVEVYGNPNFPYLNSMVNGTAGVNTATFTDYRGLTHPSQPNYLALFAGDTLGVTDNSIQPVTTFANATNLGAKLLNKGRTFVGYSEDLPSVGSQDEFANNSLYARKHNPWANWQNDQIALVNRLPDSVNRPYAGAGNWPATDFSQLPDVSIIVPNQDHDGHNTTDTTADTWLQNNMQPYITWANAHNGLLIVTWDEDIGTGIEPTLFAGPMVKQGSYNETISHYNLLATLEQIYGLTHDTLNTQNASVISDVWIVPEPDLAIVIAGAIPLLRMRSRRRK